MNSEMSALHDTTNSKMLSDVDREMAALEAKRKARKEAREKRLREAAELGAATATTRQARRRSPTAVTAEGDGAPSAVPAPAQEPEQPAVDSLPKPVVADAQQTTGVNAASAASAAEQEAARRAAEYEERRARQQAEREAQKKRIEAEIQAEQEATRKRLEARRAKRSQRKQEGADEAFVPAPRSKAGSTSSAPPSQESAASVPENLEAPSDSGEAIEASPDVASGASSARAFVPPLEAPVPEAPLAQAVRRVRFDVPPSPSTANTSLNSTVMSEQRSFVSPQIVKTPYHAKAASSPATGSAASRISATDEGDLDKLFQEAQQEIDKAVAAGDGSAIDAMFEDLVPGSAATAAMEARKPEPAAEPKAVSPLLTRRPTPYEAMVLPTSPEPGVAGEGTAEEGNARDVAEPAKADGFGVQLRATSRPLDRQTKPVAEPVSADWGAKLRPTRARGEPAGTRSAAAAEPDWRAERQRKVQEREAQQAAKREEVLAAVADIDDAAERRAAARKARRAAKRAEVTRDVQVDAGLSGPALFRTPKREGKPSAAASTLAKAAAETNPAVAKALRDTELQHHESKMESRRLSIEIRKKEAAAALRENEINVSAHELSVRRSQYNTPAAPRSRARTGGGAHPAVSTPLARDATVPAPAVACSTPAAARSTSAEQAPAETQKGSLATATDAGPDPLQEPKPDSAPSLEGSLSPIPREGPTASTTSLFASPKHTIAGVTTAESSADLDLPSSPTLGSRAQRDRIRLGQQRAARPRSRLLVGNSADGEYSERPIRRHTTASALTRPVVRSRAQPVKAGDRAAEILKKTTGVSRDYEGYSLSYMMNQEVQHGSSELKATGAVLTATGKAILKTTHLDRAPTLYHVKGKKRVAVSIVPVSSGNLNSGDVFVYDAVGTIYVWYGTSCRRVERSKGKILAIDIKDVEYAGRAAIVELEEDPNRGSRSTAQDFEAFFKALGGMDAVKPAGDPEEDEEHEAAIEAAVVLHNIGVDGVDGGAEELAAGRNVKKEMMLSDHVCRLTTAHTTFLWVGRFAAAEQKACVAEEKARLSEKGVRVMVVSHNNEPAVFRHSFRLWEKGPSLGVAPLKNPAPLTTFAMRVQRSSSVPARPSSDA